MDDGKKTLHSDIILIESECMSRVHLDLITFFEGVFDVYFERTGAVIYCVIELIEAGISDIT